MSERPDIEAIKALADAATPGPWYSYHQDYNAGWYSDGIAHGKTPVIAANGAACAFRASEADKAFIAAARTAVPAMLAYIEALEAEHERMLTAIGMITQTARDEYGNVLERLNERDAASESR